MKKGKKREIRKKSRPDSKTENGGTEKRKIPKQEIAGLLLIAAGFFIFFCIINPSQSGNFGASLGVMVLRYTGWAAFSLPFLLILGGISLLHPINTRSLIVSLLLVTTGAWTVETLRCVITGSGGAWGIFLKTLLVKNLGFAGAIISLSALLISLLILFSGIRISDLFRKIAILIKSLFSALVHMCLAAKSLGEKFGILVTPLAAIIGKSREKKIIAKRSEEEIVADLREAALVAENLNIDIEEKPKKKRVSETKTSPEKEEKPNVPDRENESTEYSLPALSLLENVESTKARKGSIRDYSTILVETLESFGVAASVINVERGPSVTRYELQPAKGVKVSKITNLTNDIALNLAAPSIRIEAPVRGKSCIGIEIPNDRTDMVHIKETLQSEEFGRRDHILPVALGKDITGKAVVGDLVNMPHLLVAGATGSGKSVCVNCIVASLLFTVFPSEVQMVMIDPKVVELSMYEGIPHLIDIKGIGDDRIITDPKIATIVLQRMTEIMDKRYNEFKRLRARNIFEYNKKASTPIPYLVIIVDELADLMMVSSAQVEKHICRIAQKGRAAGIHLILATQRPSVNVITGLIKANVPSRIAFAVAQQVDSRTILDRGGAEKLLGKGDMLYHPSGAGDPKRVQGAFISSEDTENIVAYWHQQPPPENIISLDVEHGESALPGEEQAREDDDDELFTEALRIIMAERQASVSLLQRKLKIGYARAGRLIDIMERRGIVGPANGSKSRAILAGGGEGTGN